MSKHCRTDCLCVLLCNRTLDKCTILTLVSTWRFNDPSSYNMNEELCGTVNRVSYMLTTLIRNKPFYCYAILYWQLVNRINKTMCYTQQKVRRFCHWIDAWLSRPMVHISLNRTDLRKKQVFVPCAASGTRIMLYRHLYAWTITMLRMVALPDWIILCTQIYAMKQIHVSISGTVCAEPYI